MKLEEEIARGQELMASGLSYEATADELNRSIAWVKEHCQSIRASNRVYTQEQKDEALAFLDAKGYAALKERSPELARLVYKWRQQRDQKARPKPSGPSLAQGVLLFAPGPHQ